MPVEWNRSSCDVQSRSLHTCFANSLLSKAMWGVEQLLANDDDRKLARETQWERVQARKTQSHTWLTSRNGITMVFHNNESPARPRGWMKAVCARASGGEKRFKLTSQVWTLNCSRETETQFRRCPEAVNETSSRDLVRPAGVYFTWCNKEIKKTWNPTPYVLFHNLLSPLRAPTGKYF